MDLLGYVLTLDLLILFNYCLPTQKLHNLDLMDVLVALKIFCFNFAELSLYLTMVFGVLPIAVACIILISFKMYTHDFIKPIQRSYLIAAIYYISSILINLYFTDFFFNIMKQIFFYNKVHDPAVLYTQNVCNRFITVILNVIVFITSFLMLEIQIAFNLNSISLRNYQILKKNQVCLLITSLVLFYYVCLYVKFISSVFLYFNSFYIPLLLLNNSFLSVTLISILFYHVYLYYVNTYILTHSRMYREIIE